MLVVFVPAAVVIQTISRSLLEMLQSYRLVSTACPCFLMLCRSQVPKAIQSAPQVSVHMSQSLNS